MTRRRTPGPIFWIALTFALLLHPRAEAKESSQPNILFVLADNAGWGDFGAYAGGELRGAPSPHIDRMAREGLLLQNFNTEPQCTPSRSALMTGRFAVRSGNQSVPIGVPYYGLVPWEITIAELLSGKGYATGIFGKWHLGKTGGRFPTDQGFDEWYGIPNSTDESVWASADQVGRFTNAAELKASVPDSQIEWIMEAQRGRKPERVKPYDLQQRRLIDAELTRRAIDFMGKNAREGKPFFAFVPLTAMHYPTLPHPDFEGRTGHGDYTDMLVQTDDYVGRMLASLKELGIEGNTLVIFASDNGPEAPENGNGLFSGWTGPWAGTYFTALEGGLRAPCILRWPGKIPPGRRSDEIVHIVDFFPTLARLAGAKVPADRPIDGVDLTDFILGKSGKSGRQGFPIFVGNDLYALKWRNWKAHYIWQETKYSPKVVLPTVPKVVNLITDPREERNVAEPYNTWLQYPMGKVLIDFQRSVKQYPNVPVGAPDSYQPPK